MTEWDRCSGYLEEACEGWTLDAVRAEIDAGRAVFWPMAKSAVVTQVLEYPKARVLRIWLAGGDLEEIKYFLPAADNYARSVGCSEIEVEGRLGWERVLTGYEKRRVILVKELT